MYDQELIVAMRAVREACRVCQRVQRILVKSDTLVKGDKSPVTVADFASQALICKQLGEHFSLDPVVGEEGSADLQAEGAEELREAVRVVVSQALGTEVLERAVMSWIDRGAYDPAGEEEPPKGATPGRYWTLDPIDGTKQFRDRSGDGRSVFCLRRFRDDCHRDFREQCRSV